MRFIVSRTSTRFRETTPPCDNAQRGTCTRVDRRNTDDPKTIPSRRGSDGAWWYAEGENHRIENGTIARDFPGEGAWFIDIPDLDALIAFKDEHAVIVIHEHLFCWDYPEIEIYDDYRE